MALANTHTNYGSAARVFHWLTALLVLTLIPVAVIANELPYSTSEELALKAFLFSLHKTLGIAVFFVALLRIIWAISQPKPTALHPERKVETFMAETAHWLLYGSLVLAPLSGWVHHAATAGFAPIWWPFGQNLPLIAKSTTVEAVTYGLHWVFGKVMAATILLHIAAALKHHIIDRDATLSRMLYHMPNLPKLTIIHHSAPPAIAAIAIWATVLSGAAAFGLYAPHERTTQAAALEQVASDWTVQDGSIGITITQLGSTVEGSFADWTAEISFDREVTSGSAGEVEVIISIGSLTIGSVTDQAMGPDFFSESTFPTATFSADLITSADGNVADGTLTIREQSVPVQMPFSLSVGDGVADVTADLTLDRRDFSIGDNMTDEGSLGFSVQVDIALTATRGDGT
jgi:cytochrome b561/polyisoprenoid-binding protein YceI